MREVQEETGRAPRKGEEVGEGRSDTDKRMEDASAMSEMLLIAGHRS